MEEMSLRIREGLTRTGSSRPGSSRQSASRSEGWGEETAEDKLLVSASPRPSCTPATHTRWSGASTRSPRLAPLPMHPHT